ncbi:disease resistance family protein / LRR family protein [Euphorbia peplus]|nr:disease resistance family protein / LRR family protein [Euphorbia peplus]
MLLVATPCLGGCIESERNALLHFKNGLLISYSRLSDWGANGSDCCTWTSVICHNITSHVIELQLRTLSPEEYFRGSDPDYYEYEEYWKKSALGGNMSSSLLELKHLSYLDLSNNDFGGVLIPKFIGSLESLRYLN